MRALTLIRPWAWAVCCAGKRIENRTWAPSERQLAPGDRFAIHAGKGWDADAAAWMRDNWVDTPTKALDPLGIVAVATFRGYGSPGLLAAARTVDEAQLRHWAHGPICWLLADVVVLPEAIPCRGAQGLWTVPAEIEARIADARRGP